MGRMTQEERWMIRYKEVMEFMVKNQGNGGTGTCFTEV